MSKELSDKTSSNLNLSWHGMVNNVQWKFSQNAYHIKIALEINLYIIIVCGTVCYICYGVMFINGD